MKRRAFLVTSVALAAAGGLPRGRGAAVATRGALAVIDTRIAGDPALARAVAARGLRVFAAGDDAGALWYASLAPRLARGERLLIGVTRASDAFVLGELARDVQCVLLRHRVLRAGGAVAFLIGPRSGSAGSSDRKPSRRSASA